ncbi:hypothetical protein AVEN_260248-1 [Araneus ventricosus]|uniref:Uncharacterized protein n=1 Tax=Araneus ventricosus TaxID=182803 RepID=A0A4Y2ECK5_ARAVE|nr:hypothetical protein AVEN_259102-1 [Araneus ventricosus]GBM26497.1 hypothetical protein AVEN_260248-1 [Araneus ventricosus]
MDELAAEISTGSSSGREAGKVTGIPESPMRRLLHGSLNLYPYKIQTLHQLLHVDFDERQNFATWALAQMERDPQWLLNPLFTAW